MGEGAVRDTSSGPTVHVKCMRPHCRTDEYWELADFLGHDVTGHRALRALLQQTHVRMPWDLRDLTNEQIKCLYQLGASGRKRIRDCMRNTAVMERPRDVEPPQDIAALIRELVVGDRIFNVRRTADGFNAVVSPGDDRWYVVDLTMKVVECEAPRTFHVWERESD